MKKEVVEKPILVTPTILKELKQKKVDWDVISYNLVIEKLLKEVQG